MRHLCLQFVGWSCLLMADAVMSWKGLLTAGIFLMSQQTAADDDGYSESRPRKRKTRLEFRALKQNSNRQLPRYV
jgi:hypothetical protein